MGDHELEAELTIGGLAKQRGHLCQQRARHELPQHVRCLLLCHRGAKGCQRWATTAWIVPDVNEGASDLLAKSFSRHGCGLLSHPGWVERQLDGGDEQLLFRAE